MHEYTMQHPYNPTIQIVHNGERELKNTVSSHAHTHTHNHAIVLTVAVIFLPRLRSDYYLRVSYRHHCHATPHCYVTLLAIRVRTMLTIALKIVTIFI